MKLRKNTWKKIRLGELTNLITDGKHGDCVNEANSGYYFLSAKDILNKKLVYDNARQITRKDFEETHRRTNLEPGDVLITNAGTIGRIAIAEEDDKTIRTTFQKSVAVIKTKKEKLDNHYCSFQLEADINKLMSVSSGTAQKNLLLGDLRKHEIPLPSLPEQTQIAELFQSIETAIEQAEQQEKNLLKLKNQLLRELTGEKMQFGNSLKENDFEKVKFEQIAFSISERVEPKKTALTTYVGLEHLDADNLKIERTGTPNDVIGTKLKIFKGDIIFGKRRAYLRKVAVSHFDGIASAHSMILRANEKRVEKSFLPHFLQSDVFMQRAVQISEGSLSPTIKWKTLAAQEFVLPKKEKQKQLSEVFEQFDKTRDEIKTQIQTLKNLKQKLLNEILG